MLIIQFIIILWQDLFNEITTRMWIIPSKLYLYYKKFCKKRVLSENPSSLLTFISENMGDFVLRNYRWIPTFTLFGGRWRMKKVGLI